MDGRVAQSNVPVSREADVDALPVTERGGMPEVALDELPTIELLGRMNAEDAVVAGAVARTLPAIARAVDAIATLVAGGGRLVLVGAGTSGRLAVIEAAEVMPTFGIQSGVVVAVMAGGTDAVSTPSRVPRTMDQAAGQPSNSSRSAARMPSSASRRVAGRSSCSAPSRRREAVAR